MSSRRLSLSLEAVIVAVTDGRPRILTTTHRNETVPALPSGLLDPDSDATLELGLRRWIAAQTGLEVGYVEQLYTFGDRDRERGTPGTRHLSVAYLGLVKEAQPAPGAAWLDCYTLLPWEDHRVGATRNPQDAVIPGLSRWASGHPGRQRRVRSDFGERGSWDPIRVLERYELLYEARLIPEYFRDRGQRSGAAADAGLELAFDHRRIAATALGRLRGKLKYRPVVFELLPERFTLLQLQRTVEALTGVRLHKQNFRRLVERGRLVESTGAHDRSARGRPAKLVRFRQEIVRARLY